MTNPELIYHTLITIEDAVSKFFISGDYKTAETVLFSLRDKAITKNDEVKYWTSSLYIGNCYQRSGETIKATNVLSNILNNCNIIDIKILALQFLGRVYSQTGDSQKAIKCLEHIAIWRKKGILFSEREYIARLELPGLWRIGLHKIRIGDVKKGDYALQSHKEFLYAINYQKANSLSCFAIASMIKGSRDYDSILSAILESRDLYLKGSSDSSASGLLWRMKASISTLLVEAAVDNVLFNKLSSYLKLFIVRIFLRKYNLSPNTEGIGEIVSVLEEKFPEMRKILYLNETKFRDWIKSIEYHDAAIEADRLAIEKVKEWENEGERLTYSAIYNCFEGLSEYGRSVIYPFAKGKQSKKDVKEKPKEILISGIDYLKGGAVSQHVNIGIAHIPIQIDSSKWPITLSDPKLVSNLFNCALLKMIDSCCNVLCFPEFSFNEISKKDLLNYSEGRIIIAGTQYSQHHNRCYVFIDKDMFFFDKITPSDFENGNLVKGNTGMKEGSKLTILNTKYGKIVVFICRDFIRHWTTLQDLEIDIMIVVAHNPSEEGIKRIKNTAEYIISNKPVYVLISDSGPKADSSLFGRLHKNYVAGLKARKIIKEDMNDYEIVNTDKPSIIKASLDIKNKSPIIPSPSSPSPNISNIEIIPYN